jgi:hypothetical protein
MSALPALASAQESGEWELSGVARHDTVRGEPALRFATGGAVRRDVSFRDGSIEFDVAMTGERSFVYLQFRMASDDDSETIYLRPHKSGLPDAVQYTPVFGGAAQWQLYHGEGGTAAAKLPHDGWLHVRLEVENRRARLYLGGAEAPVLEIDRLARDPVAGPISVSAFRPGPAEDESFVAAFRNVTVRPSAPGTGATDDTAVRGPEVSGTLDEDGRVRRWRVAAPFDAGDPPWAALPARLETGAGWRTLETEPNALLLLQRHLPRRPGRQTTAAKLTLVSDAARTIPLDLGFSDAVTVFLDGRPLLSEDDGYSFDEPRRDGLIGLDQARVYLPLRAGENELVILVTDTFGGWGLMARFPEREGIRVEGAASDASGGLALPVRHVDVARRRPHLEGARGRRGVRG